jgi:hypothetical protein
MNLYKIAISHLPVGTYHAAQQEHAEARQRGTHRHELHRGEGAALEGQESRGIHPHDGIARRRRAVGPLQVLENQLLRGTARARRP